MTATPAATNSSMVTPFTHALIAATVDSFFHGRARIVSAEPASDHVKAILAATVHTLFDGRARVVAVDTRHPDTAWAKEGRRDIFHSHRVR